MRAAIYLFALLSLLPAAASADGNAPARRPRRDRFAGTLSLGFSLGAGSPTGFVGSFIEYRPFRYVSASVGGGLGGWFGPAIATSLYIDPIVTRGWALGIGGGYSHNFSWVQGQVVQGRAPLPAGTDWLNLEVQTQIRPARGWFMRFGVGHSVLMNTRAFRIANEAELAALRLPDLPGTSPDDAIRAAARDQTLTMWYVHLDIAMTFRL